MKFVGGYDLPIEGKPSDDVTVHEIPEVLYLPLFSRSFDYTALQVENGDSVTQGQILATDPTNFFAPLLAPASGTVNLDLVERHITLENLSSDKEAPPEEVNPDNRRQMMMRLGIWPLMTRVDTGKMPDPERDPEVLLISIARSEPFYPSPGALLAGKSDQFASGLEQLHRIFDEAKIHLIVPEALTDIEAELQGCLKDCGDWASIHRVEDRYPSDNPALVAQSLECELDSVWTLDAQAVLACDAAINRGLPHVTRIVAVSGPVFSSPAHCQIPLGYPLASLVAAGGVETEVRMIDGGVLTGAAIAGDQRGLDTQCVSLTCLQENTEREVLAFVQVGLNKQSYSKTFASVFKPLFKEKYTTALRGEARPCISCGYCEDVCPAELKPFLIYRYLSNDRLEDAGRVGLEQCVECGLCSYVCLSKIEHLIQFREERRKCEDEKDARE